MAIPSMSNSQSASSGVGPTSFTGSYQFGDQNVGAPWWSGMQGSDKTLLYAALGITAIVVFGKLWKSKR